MTLVAMKQVPLKARAQYEVLFVLEHYLRKSQRISRQKEKARLRIADHVAKQGKGRVIQVERLTEKLSPEDFFRRYLSRGIPVILDKAAADWTCTREWSFDVFNQRYGRETIKLVNKIGLSDDDFVDEREFSEEIEFGAFLDQVLNGGRKYMRFSPLLEKFPELANDFDKPFLREMSGNSWGVTYELFIGGKGTITPLHNAMTPFFFVNVRGQALDAHSVPLSRHHESARRWGQLQPFGRRAGLLERRPVSRIRLYRSNGGRDRTVGYPVQSRVDVALRAK